MSLSFYVTFVSLVAFTAAQVSLNRPCPKLDVVQNFDMQRYSGRWYEIEKYPNAFEKAKSCVTARYIPRSDRMIDVHHRYYDPKLDEYNEVHAELRVIDPKLGGKLSLEVLDDQHHRPVPREGNYWVLDTDYDRYAIVWDCEPEKDKEDHSLQFLWVLSRVRFPHEDELNHVNQKMTQLELQRHHLVKTEQGNCPPNEDYDGIKH